MQSPMSASRQQNTSSERVYIGNRLVPSPSNCTSRDNSSLNETIEVRYITPDLLFIIDCILTFAL